jgi:hypothetical protein
MATKGRTLVAIFCGLKSLPNVFINKKPVSFSEVVVYRKCR